MRKTLALALALLMALSLVLAGCGNDTASESGTPGSGTAAESTTAEPGSETEPEPVTLRYMWWGSQTRHDHNLAMIDMYMEQNPHVTIEPEYTGWDGYWDKASAMAAAGNLPDVWQMSVAYVLAYQNQLNDLQPYIDSGIIDLSDWEDVFTNLAVVNGGNYGLTLGNSAYCVAYNPEMLAEAGVENPTLEWTWDDYTNAIETVTDKTDYYGDGNYPMHIIEGYIQALRQNGKQLVNDTRDGLDYKETDIWIEYFTEMKKQMDAGTLVPMDQAVNMQSAEQMGIATGVAAFHGALNSNQAVAASNALGKDLGVTMYPHKDGESQPGTFIGPTMLLSMSKSTAHAEEAAKFMNFMLNDVEANKISMMEKGVPASAAVRDAVAPLLTPTGQAVADYVGDVAATVAPYDNIYPVAHGEMVDLYNRLVQDMMFGNITIEAAAEQFNTEADAILAAGAAK